MSRVIDAHVSLIVAEDEAGTRLDQLLKRHLPARSRSYLQKLIEEGHVRISAGRAPANAEPSRRVREGWRVEVAIPEPREALLQPWALPLSVLRETRDYVAIDKPAGLVVHPGAGQTEHTLAHAVLHRYPEVACVGSCARPGIVHRLDKGTSGVMLVARTQAAYADLVRQFSDHEVEKVYLAIVAGIPDPESGEIDAPIGRAAHDRKRFTTRSRMGKPARTRFRLLERGAGFSLLEVRIETGRTHQIRVHLTARGHPILGDPTYGRPGRRLPHELQRIVLARGGPYLHARRIGFVDPESRQRVTVSAPPPVDFRHVWEALSG